MLAFQFLGCTAWWPSRARNAGMRWCTTLSDMREVCRTMEPERKIRNGFPKSHSQSLGTKRQNLSGHIRSLFVSFVLMFFVVGSISRGCGLYYSKDRTPGNLHWPIRILINMQMCVHCVSLMLLQRSIPEIKPWFDFGASQGCFWSLGMTHEASSFLTSRDLLTS